MILSLLFQKLFKASIFLILCHFTFVDKSQQTLKDYYKGSYTLTQAGHYEFDIWVSNIKFWNIFKWKFTEQILKY